MRIKLRSTKIYISFMFAGLVFVVLSYTADTLPFLLLLSSLLHEAGHLVIIYINRVPVKEIRFCFFGMNIIRAPGKLCSIKREVFTHLAGPLVNLAIATVAFVFYTLSLRHVYVRLATLNAFLGIFNLLPVYSLDGGSALYAHICARKPAYYADKVITVISFIIIVPVIILGTLLLISNKWNFSLLVAGVYLALMLVLKKQSECL